MLREILHFFVHLRLHYQFFILSGAYLCGGLYCLDLDPKAFALQFLNVHVLLFGGATAYNSFWDKDEGPIGGLRNPPPMTKWMHVMSLAIQVAGLVWAVSIGWLFVGVYVVSMILFWLYSTPLARWKGHPWLSLVAIAFSTGTNGFLLGYLASGARDVPVAVIAGALGVALSILSMYPVSQVFQVEDDTARGDRTFTVAYGLQGVRRFWLVCYVTGQAMLAASLYTLRPMIGAIFAGVGVVAFVFIGVQIRSLRGETSEYKAVMRLKYGTSLLFVLFITSCLVWTSL